MWQHSTRFIFYFKFFFLGWWRGEGAAEFFSFELGTNVDRWQRSSPGIIDARDSSVAPSVWKWRSKLVKAKTLCIMSKFLHCCCICRLEKRQVSVV
jgi:hypothetical protein